MFDVIIIGAGPAGLAAAIEAKRSGLSYCVVEKGGIVESIQKFPAGMTFFSTPELLEIGGVPFTSAHMRPTRAESLEYYSRVADYYSLDLRLYEKVLSVQKGIDGFRMETSKDTYGAKNIIIATGYYDHPNTLGIPGEDFAKVSHFYNEPYPFYKQKVAVIGAKNSAAIAVLELYRHGANVTLIHRGTALSEKIKYWILPDIENRIKEGSITAYFNTVVEEIRKDSILIRRDNTLHEIPNDFVFALTGYRPDYAFLHSLGIELDPDSMAPNHSSLSFETNIKGIFVAGSVVAGKNNNQIFIENGRLHGTKIITAIANRK